MIGLRYFVLTVLAAATAACDASRPAVATPASPRPSPTPVTAPAPPEKHVTLGDVGLDPTALDRTADPCQDFYQYACGGWLAKNEIPADRTRVGRNIEIVERNQNALRSILESASSQSTGDPALQAVGTFYGTCVDEAALEAAGTKGIDPLVKKVRAVRDLPSLVAAVAELHRHGIFSIFVIGSEQDAKDATRVIARLDQGGLGLPDRDDYLNDDARSKEIRTHYLDHVGRMMQLAGKKPADAKKAADDVMAIETALARASKTRVERRDPSGMYNKVDRAGLARLAPTWGWSAYFKGLGFEGLHDFNVTAPGFLQGLEHLLASTKPAAWQAYLEWHVLNATADALPKRFDDESFTMWRFLSGQQKQRDRWRRCVTATDAALGESLGRFFVARHFAGESRDVVRQMIAAISEAFDERFGELDWMDEKTKEHAREKRQQMAYLIGYPNTWRVYDFSLDKKVHAANVLAGKAFEVKRQLTKVGKPVDREDWQMSPPTVNAYYDPQLNQMAFPAGILQPPFFSARSGLAVNMGATGETIGHELIHGFDDEGSRYDGKGNLASWWEPETRRRFEARAQCVVDQYSAYEPLPGVKINGKLTLGENIADIGGLKLAFRAYRALRKSAEERIRADGFDEDQQFFLSFGQSQCTKWREERARTLLQTDPHSLAKFRVNGSVTNMPEFARAFSCAEGKALNPKQRCDVW
ncbi:M13 family metallopeptidase [Polyangium jinanense]|uniref:M13 family metallopeptidase n=1 Tax=Polyangium jinanense TaxID=2829994 RepID=UPI00233FCDC9|nr:M13 family metallopeptidase [Polyangium jinanense]